MKTPKTDFQMEINLRTKGWGISIHDNRIVVSAIGNRFNKARYIAHAVLEDYPSKSDDAVREFIDEFIDEHRLKRGEAFLGLAREEVRTRVVEFPREAEESLDEVLEYQLENIFPGNYEEFDYFHQKIARHDQLHVLVIAVRKEVMGRVFSEIRKWGLQLAGVTLDSCAFVNALSRLNGEAFKQGQYGLMQFTGNALELAIVREGRLILNELLPWRDDHMRDDLVSGLEGALSAARVDPNEVDVFYQCGWPNQAVKSFLVDEIGFRFEPLTDSSGQQIPDEALIATSLALTAIYDKVPLELNVLPVNLRKRHRRLPLLIASILALTACGYFGYTEYRTYRTLKTDLEFVLNTNDRLESTLADASALQLAFDKKKEEVESLYKYRYSDEMVLKLLFELTQALPNHTYLTSFSIRDGDQLTIQGESEEPFAIRSKLQSLPFLTDVDTKNAITPGRDPDKKKFTFGARIVLEALR